MAYGKHCDTIGYEKARILEILRSSKGQFGRAYTDSDEDGFNGKWKWCIERYEISRIIFDTDEEAIELMNLVVADWRDQIKKNEDWGKTVDEMDQLIITKELEEVNFGKKKEEGSDDRT